MYKINEYYHVWTREVTAVTGGDEMGRQYGKRGLVRWAHGAGGAGGAAVSLEVFARFRGLRGQSLSCCFGPCLVAVPAFCSATCRW
jgi:hypothetical protein